MELVIFFLMDLFKAQLCNIWRFREETATLNGYILDCSTLAFTLPSLPVGYGDLCTQTSIPRPLYIFIYVYEK